MNRRRARLLRGSALLLAAAALAAAAPRALAGSADPFAAARERGGWVVYRVPITAADQGPCCYKGWQRAGQLERGCTLEGGRGRGGMFGTIDSPGMRARAAALQLYLRFERGEVRQVLAVGDDCPVEVGRVALTELAGVTPAASTALLLGVAARASEDLAESALHAVALHEGAGIDALLALARDPAQPRRARRQAFFWLGQSEDPRALAEIEKVLSR